MTGIENQFKRSLLAGDQLIGLWLALGDDGVAELCSHVGFDWLLIDGEHGPHDLRSILSQLRAIQGSGTHAVVRLASDDRVLIKRHLDIGCNTILIPMVESGDQAREIVRSCRYAPAGARGIGAAFARASRFGGIADYLHRAADELCILVQVETRRGLAALDAILAVEGVDGVFVGPSDLAADMGKPGRAGDDDVQAAVEGALRAIRAAGKASGILTSDAVLAQRYRALGVGFLAVGADVVVLSSGLRALRDRFA